MASAAHYHKQYPARNSFALGFLVRALLGKPTKSKSDITAYTAHLGVASSRPEFKAAMKNSNPGKPLSER